jgi:hypothetical protein
VQKIALRKAEVARVWIRIRSLIVIERFNDLNRNKAKGVSASPVMVMQPRCLRSNLAGKAGDDDCHTPFWGVQLLLRLWGVLRCDGP